MLRHPSSLRGVNIFKKRILCLFVVTISPCWGIRAPSGGSRFSKMCPFSRFHAFYMTNRYPERASENRNEKLVWQERVWANLIRTFIEWEVRWSLNIHIFTISGMRLHIAGRQGGGSGVGYIEIYWTKKHTFWKIEILGYGCMEKA